MLKSTKTLVAASVFALGLAAAPALYAQSQGSGGSMMGPGMMGPGMMGQGGMMGQMSEMMEGCSKMMQSMTNRDGSGKPNQQWREKAPENSR